MEILPLVPLASLPLTEELQSSQPIRTAVIAETPKDLVEHLQQLEQMLNDMPPAPGEVKMSPQKDIWLGNSVKHNRVAFLFPGQGPQKLNMARKLVERYSWAREFLAQADRWLQEMKLEPIGQYIYHPLERATDREQIQDWHQKLTPAPNVTKIRETASR